METILLNLIFMNYAFESIQLKGLHFEGSSVKLIELCRVCASIIQSNMI